jgi:hypothetical protein
MDRDRLATAFQLQAGLCRHLASPLYAELMDAAREDVMAGGAVARLLDDWEGDPVAGFLPLRLFGAVHACVLSGDAPELAAHYPTAGGRLQAEGAWPAFLAALAAHPSRIREVCDRFPQTNEVRRTAGLLGGFLEIAGQTGLPLRLREIGCSAGLNLQWSRFAYALGERRWGNADSPVQIHAAWEGPPARFELVPQVESRAGCDIAPRAIDAEGARILESYVWPDQPERLDQIRGAVALARAEPPRIDRCEAAEWLERELAQPTEGCCTVVYHSSVWIYLSDDEQARIRALLAAAGARANARASLAWLRHEDDDAKTGKVEIRATLWPGGEERLLGYGHHHGREVRWLG